MAQTLRLGTCTVEIREPSVPSDRVLLLLPGWNYPRTAWCDSSIICTEALRRGYRLLLFEMGKSIYASQIFPETRLDWRVFPTLRTLLDTVFPSLVDMGFLEKGKGYLLGLSTGGRGVVLLLAHMQNFFVAGAALSGDFDPHLNPRDPLLTGWYGRYSQRWEEIDNPLRLSAQIERPLFLAHGVADPVVSYLHSQRLYERLRALHPHLPCELYLDPKGKHDFVFWEKAARKALDFFERYGRK
ncbi:MAG: prolyl oligopeptidase family serine peptidase [Bacteroidia bacterium]|nr:prolyl oligopeptidase family serine peptidase [Bacteroidia bacterium]MDW8016039.1 prolyl oligopeptidase family serine peptidase [Bacteroidia bacterium]